MPTAILLNPDDIIFDFEHMMAHRRYFAVMKPLYGFSALPYNLDPAYGVGEEANPWNQNHQQAHSDFNGALPGNAENGYTIKTVNPPTVTGTGTTTATPPTGSATNITLSALSGTFILGSTITGGAIPAGTTITAQVSGAPGGNGVYTLSQSYTLPTPVTVTITHASFQQATAIAGYAFGINQGNVLIEGLSDKDEEQRQLWAFWNHTEHMVADNAILPLPTQAAVTAGTGPGTVTGISDPWWWAAIGGQVIFPYW